MSVEACSRVIAYYRLSEKDKLKAVSDSIENQKKLIREYISKRDDLILVDELYDDGYTGTNYDRPGFCAVMTKVEAGEVDCIIVKDLSRLGREYIETGRYIEETFPSKGVRFIAVNDEYDSNTPKESDDILIPVKNLMNETYCRELSHKLRRQFVVQRNNGEFLGAFAAYGYRKAAEDKHKLVVDEFAAEIVRNIFYYKMQGYSQQAIANTLNAEGILSPAEYKRQQGFNYQSGFLTNEKPMWGASAVTSILRNRLYIGELAQGKRGTPNFKIKKSRLRPPEEWSVVENNHEPIVDPLIFDIVQKMMQRDTRISPERETVLPLGGMVFCSECMRAMNVRSVRRGKKTFRYYICSTYKRGHGCSSHNFGKEQLEETIFNAIKTQIDIVVELQSFLSSMSSSELRRVKLQKTQKQIEEKEKEKERYEDFKSRLLEALSDGLISHDEYLRMLEKYRTQIKECDDAIETLTRKMEDTGKNDGFGGSWVEQYLKYRDLRSLTREAVVTLIDRVIIHENKQIEIHFNYRDELTSSLSLSRDVLNQEAG